MVQSCHASGRMRYGPGSARERHNDVERGFALILDRGGMRRVWLRGRDNVQKRYLIHVAGYNLGLIMRLLTGRSSFGCAARTSNCAWSATSSLERPPGLLARPARCRPGLRVHEREPGRLSDCDHGARARRVGGRLPCVATSSAVRPCDRRRAVAEAGSDRACEFARDLWGAARTCAASGSRREASTQARSATDAHVRAHGCQPPPRGGDDHAARQGCAAGAGFGGSELHCDAAEPALGRRHQCAAASGVRDGGWPPATGLQEQVANHRKRRGSKARVVSVTEKAPRGVR